MDKYNQLHVRHKTYDKLGLAKRSVPWSGMACTAHCNMAITDEVFIDQKQQFNACIKKFFTIQIEWL